MASSWLSGWFGLASGWLGLDPGWLSGWFGLASGWLGLVWLGSLFFSMFFSLPCRNAAAGHFASVSRVSILQPHACTSVLDFESFERGQMLDGQVLGASQVEYKPFGKPRLKRYSRSSSLMALLHPKTLRKLSMPFALLAAPRRGRCPGAPGKLDPIHFAARFALPTSSLQGRSGLSCISERGSKRRRGKRNPVPSDPGARAGSSPPGVGLSLKGAFRAATQPSSGRPPCRSRWAASLGWQR